MHYKRDHLKMTSNFLKKLLPGPFRGEGHQSGGHGGYAKLEKGKSSKSAGDNQTQHSSGHPRPAMTPKSSQTDLTSLTVKPCTHDGKPCRPGAWEGNPSAAVQDLNEILCGIDADRATRMVQAHYNAAAAKDKIFEDYKNAASRKRRPAEKNIKSSYDQHLRAYYEWTHYNDDRHGLRQNRAAQAGVSCFRCIHHDEDRKQIEQRKGAHALLKSANEDLKAIRADLTADIEAIKRIMAIWEETHEAKVKTFERFALIPIKPADWQKGTKRKDLEKTLYDECWTGLTVCLSQKKQSLKGY